MFERRVVDVDGLAALVTFLHEAGYRVLGPQIRDGAIVIDDLPSADALPIGWRDEQSPGHYRLHRRDDAARFGYAASPTGWKRFLHPPEVRLWTATVADREFSIEPPMSDDRPLAMVGVRGCDLAAIAVLDTVMRSDKVYAARRADAFIVAVACGSPAATCFCTRTDTGPRPSAGFDLLLTELVDGSTAAPRYLAEPGSTEGERMLASVPSRPAAADDDATAAAVVREAEQIMGHHPSLDGVREALASRPEHPRWTEVATRCLTCGNCTTVCPTCFCNSVSDSTDLATGTVARDRRWASCFELDFSYVHPGPVRTSPRSRYRQWLTHKLSTWYDQFGSSGCVGCGRCVTWCPVGIDLVEEAVAVRDVPAEVRGTPVTIGAGAQ